jgi:N-methylhydantoinase B
MKRSRRDPIEIEIFKNIFHSIAEEMGAALRRTSFSPNIKERRDYSCAVFDAAGEVVAMGDHMPVHLGSMPMSVRAAITECDLAPGDIVMLNDPFRGGTHLPDITLVMPVYTGVAQPPSAVRKSTQVEGRDFSIARLARNTTPAKGRDFSRADAPGKKAGASAPAFFVACRAHHADVGGTFPGSMGLCEEIYQEGFRIPPVKIVRAGEMQRDILALLLNNVRTPAEREGDLGAQIAACHTGAQRLQEITVRYGLARVHRAMADLQDYAEELMRAFLARVPAGVYSAEDFLDDDGITDDPVRIAVKIAFRDLSSRAKREQRERKSRDPVFAPAVTIDFTGSSPQVRGSINAVEAITFSACFYVFRCLVAEDVPAAAGLMRPVKLIAPLGTVVNARPPAAVAGGNVETSQRITDTLLRALAKAVPDRVPAASSGTMNNLTIGGLDDRVAQTPFAYYETIAGGMGARPTKDGVSGVHTHMTNSLNTPAEALEHAYPIRVTEYSLRRGSAGAGKFRGGDGIVREVELLSDAQVTLLADRRKRGPYGLSGGSDGAAGKTTAIKRDGSAQPLPAKGSVRLQKGDRVRIETSGGGGWGRHGESS